MEENFVKYPIGIQDFESLIEDGFIYIDKTGFIYQLATGGKCYFLSRPRRFGKSLTLSTLKAYFEGKKDLFKGLAIYELEKEWKKHPVFLFSFARFEKTQQNSLEDLLDFYLKIYEKEYGIEKQERDTNFSNRFAQLVMKAYEVTGQKVVVLVDEYDSALVSTITDPDMHEHMKNLLKPFFTVLKDLDSHVRFAFLTGITRFSRMTIFSGLNNINDISLDSKYSALCGVTPDELEKYFRKGIEKLAEDYGKNYGEMIQELKAYYDGYHFSKKSPDIYNPFSILNVLSKAEMSNYWFSTGIPSFIVKRMKENDIDLEKYMNPSASETILSEADNAYTSETAILFQAGFLTIKGYEEADGVYKLGIPNREVREGMSTLFMQNFLSPDELNNISVLTELSRSVKDGNPEKFLTILQGFFAGVPFDMSKGDKEVYFHNAFYIVTNLLGLRVKTERHISTGSIDIVISTPLFVYIIEIKLNKTAQEALDQIESKNYTLPWVADGRKVFKIGVNFSSESRTLSDWIIR